MRIEMICLIGIVALAILVGQLTPAQTRASDEQATEPTTPDRAAGAQDAQAAAETIENVHRICALTAAQRRELTGRLAGICRKLEGTERRLWRQVRGLSRPTAHLGYREDIQQLQQRCEQLAWRKELHIRQVLTKNQRTIWLAEQIRPRLEAELRGLVLSPAQRADLQRHLHRVLDRSAPEVRVDNDLLLTIVRQVYLEVLTGRQRLAYADLVRRRDQAMRVARAQAD
jgi:hypothetical protein